MATGRPRSRRRRLAGFGMGIVFFAVGLFVLFYSTEIANRLAPYFPAEPAGPSGTAGLAYASYVPYMVWGFGISLIGAGAGLFRMALMTSVMGMGAGGMGGLGGVPMSPDLMQAQVAQMETLAARAQVATSPPKADVRVKCRNCGNLEAEDAEFCRKCGKPL